MGKWKEILRCKIGGVNLSEKEDKKRVVLIDSANAEKFFDMLSENKKITKNTAKKQSTCKK
jgi:CRISPR/Cas system-associated exonuclease Cas4 (RecB family)